MPSSKDTPLQNVAFQLTPTASVREAVLEGALRAFLPPLEVLHTSQCLQQFLQGH